MFDQPLPCLWIAEIQQLGPPSGPRSHSGCSSSSHVPGVTRSGSNQTIDFTPFGMGVITDRPQTAGKPLGVHFPGSDVRPTRFVPIPARIHPPVVELESFREITVDEVLLARLSAWIISPN